MPKAKDLIVDPEFAAFLPPQSAEELSGLEESLLANGCLDKLKAQEETGILVDGHTRKRLCDKHKIPYEVEYLSIPGGREGALTWMIQFQSDRRNLTDEQRSYIRGNEFLAKKKAVGRPKADAESNGKPEETEGETAAALAAKYDVGERTIYRDAQFATAVNELPAKERVAVLRGESTLPRKAIAGKAPKKKPAKAKKSGQPKFPWGEYSKVFGRLRRAVDEIAKAFDCAECNEHRSARKLLNDYAAKIEEWRERLEAKSKEKE